MQKIFVICCLILFGATTGYSQTAGKDDNGSTNSGEVRHERNYSWIGLLGLAGLAGLKSRKSEDAKRLESHGVKVSTL